MNFRETALTILSSGVSGTYLDFQTPPSLIPGYVENTNVQHEENDCLFTSGSAPRGYWTTQGHRSSIHTNKGVIVDLSGMTQNCILGINDEWVKLCQASFLLSDHPHYVTIRIGFDLYYRYAKRLLDMYHAACGIPRDSNEFVLNHRSCNGSDAVELAVHAAQMAKLERKKLVSFRGSYHGQNLTTALISEHQVTQFLVPKPCENVLFFPTPGVSEHDDDITLLRLDQESHEIFAVVLEPIQVRNNVHTIPHSFLRRLHTICQAREICLIFDEIQTGFGYLGTLCYSEICGIVPDIACFSKGTTSGHGALAVTVHRKKYSQISPTFSGKTNSGDVLTLVAANAVLDRLFGIPSTVPLPPNMSNEAELRVGLLNSRYPVLVENLNGHLEKLKQLFPSTINHISGFGLVRGVSVLGKKWYSKRKPVCMDL
eukprot:PhF_6_TR11181/c1_g1_i1/m.18018/K00821/argD; acetylornithine/N-succinyldiaminopimelate aminotransferase